PEAVRGWAGACAAAAGVAIDIASCEHARTTDGRIAVSVGCRVGDAPLRHGVGLHADAAGAALDALVSAINRSAWHCADRRAAA
ncbi:2-isopropylmalate synthase, partial [Burkholderia cepacia]|nr:2-isopropylmalate synthase [Burkholderia cepacia]